MSKIKLFLSAVLVMAGMVIFPDNVFASDYDFLEFDGEDDYAYIDSANLRSVHNKGEVTYQLIYFKRDKLKDHFLIQRGSSKGCDYEPSISEIAVFLSGCNKTGQLASLKLKQEFRTTNTK